MKNKVRFRQYLRCVIVYIDIQSVRVLHYAVDCDYIDDLISQANEIKQQKENELLKAKQEQEERELQNKKQAKKELISINNFLSRTAEAISTLQQESINFKVLDIHSSLLLNKISKAISEFKEDTKHLS